MVVFSNHRVGPSAELLVSREVGEALLREVAAAARPVAQAHWERELATWLERCATSGTPALDVSDIAWTPENFERQRGFLVDAIERAAAGSEHARALVRWCALIQAHRRELVQVRRRWRWPTAPMPHGGMPDAGRSNEQ